MKIEFIQEDTTLTALITGSINTVTATELESQLEAKREGINTLILDFAAVDYVASAGLRTLLISNKYMAKHGKMIIRNIRDDIHEIFAMTGFDTILTLE